VVTKVLTDKQCEVKFVTVRRFPDAADFDVVDNDKIIPELTPNVNRRGFFNDACDYQSACRAHLLIRIFAVGLAVADRQFDCIGCGPEIAKFYRPNSTRF